MAIATILMLALAAWCASGAPAEPVKIDLPVYERPEQGQPEDAVPLIMESTSEDRSDSTMTLIATKLMAARNLLGGRIGHAREGYAHPHARGVGVPTRFHAPIAPAHSYGIFAPPVTTLEGAVFEQEDFGSKQMTVKDNIQHFVAELIQPKPILDNIREEDKYGNNMDHAAGRAIVAGIEGVSNFVNSVLEGPGALLKKITRAASEKLNNLGGRLIGL